MRTATIGELRGNLADYIDHVSQEREPIVITRHGHPAVALVNLDDLRIIERIERQVDEIIAHAVLEELKERKAIPWDEALKQLATLRKTGE